MTTGTSLIPFKQALAALLTARAGLANVQVRYARPASGLGPEAIWLGSAVADDVAIAVMGGAVKKVREHFTLAATVQVLCSDGRDEEAADVRANALLAELQQALAAAPAGIAGVELAQFNGWEHEVGQIGDGPSRGSRFDCSIRVHTLLQP